MLTITFKFWPMCGTATESLPSWVFYWWLFSVQCSDVLLLNDNRVCIQIFFSMAFNSGNTLCHCYSTYLCLLKQFHFSIPNKNLTSIVTTSRKSCPLYIINSTPYAAIFNYQKQWDTSTVSNSYICVQAIKLLITIHSIYHSDQTPLEMVAHHIVYWQYLCWKFIPPSPFN